MKRLVLTLGVLAFTAALLTTTASARTDCSTLGSPAGTIVGGTITGGLDVTGGSCILKDVTLTGGIKMTGGRLEACGSTIKGDIDVEGGNCVTLGIGIDGGDSPAAPCDTDPNAINGGVRIENLTDAALMKSHPGSACPGRANFESEGDTVNGAVDVVNSNFAELEEGTINGTVKFEDNTHVTVGGNSINGSLFCSGNTTVTDVIDAITTPNTVTGQKKDQCSTL